VRRAAPYRALTRERFDAVVHMLADGFSTQRGRRGAYLHHDRVNGVLRGRRGAGLAAITNGGAIPDQFDYDAVLLPAEQVIGTLNEDFAIESLPGDIFQLGNTSYRIRKVEQRQGLRRGRPGPAAEHSVLARRGAGRSDELSASVARLRARVEALLEQRPATRRAHDCR
jgi:ATP-dependent helicase Lhr and Lhr-like helicase